MAVAKPITASCPQEGLNRRNLLMALPFAGAALALPKLAEAEEGQTPILRLFHQMEEISARAGKYETGLTGEDEDAELDRLFYNHRDTLEAEMMALPCTCAADFAAKVITDTVRGGLFSDWETGALWQEARALTGSAV